MITLMSLLVTGVALLAVGWLYRWDRRRSAAEHAELLAADVVHVAAVAVEEEWTRDLAGQGGGWDAQGHAAASAVLDRLAGEYLTRTQLRELAREVAARHGRVAV